jgi:septum formation protein
VRELILASQSPRRKELLAIAGFAFSVRVRPVAEVREPGENPTAYVRRLAQAKANASWEDRETASVNEIVLGADTVVFIPHAITPEAGLVLEKPKDANDARAMLGLLAGREHQVITGICMRHAGGAVVDHSVTRVRFAPISEAEIDAYVNSGEPMDKAGGYAIQGLASKFVEYIDGCYFNVMGLPLSLVYRYWKELSAG